VPYTRGRQVHRPAKEILHEVDDLIKKGYKEITLLGQMVNAYKNPEKNSRIKDFADLFEAVVARPRCRDAIYRVPTSGATWLWFTSPYPTLFTDKLIDIIAKNKNIKRHLHLPVQSGSNSVLKRMNRKYTAKKYLEIIKKIRKKIPDIAITTDIIVGFPGETKKEFEQTLNLYKKAQFDMAYTAQYSERPNTTSAKSPALKDDIPKSEKKKREQILTDQLKKIALQKNKKLLNNSVDVLVESCDGTACFGQTFQGKNIKFESEKNLTGNFVKIKIIRAEAFRLKGRILTRL
jgi:tRNA-2-methylthio-N6-dimethylallyladenosine synthase